MNLVTGIGSWVLGVVRLNLGLAVKGSVGVQFSVVVASGFGWLWE